MSILSALAPRLPAWAQREFASRLARDSLLVFLCNGLGRGMALIKELLVAYLFGVGGQLDSYILALLVPSLLVNILGASFSTALIPTLGGVTTKQGKAEADGFLASALAAQALMVAMAAMALFALPAQALHLISPGAGLERLEQVRAMQTMLLPLYALGCLANVLGAIANYHGDFKFPAVATTLNALLTIAGIAVFHQSLGVYAIIVGIDIGMALEFCILAMLVRRACGNVFKGWRGLDKGLIPVLRSWLLLAFGSIIMGLSPFIDNAIASTLTEGSISALSYAAKLPSAISTLIGLTLATVLLPHFSTIVHQAPSRELWGSCRGIMKRILLISVPIAIVGALASQFIVTALFQRGRFGAQATELVSTLQTFYFLQLPFYLLGVAAARILHAMSRFRFLLCLQAMLLCVNAATSFSLSRVMGAAGIALSSTVMYMLSSSAALYVIWRHGRDAGPEQEQAR